MPVLRNVVGQWFICTNKADRNISRKSRTGHPKTGLEIYTWDNTFESYILDRFLAIASSTALSCLRSSSLLETAFLLAGPSSTGDDKDRFLPPPPDSETMWSVAGSSRCYTSPIGNTRIAQIHFSDSNVNQAIVVASQTHGRPTEGGNRHRFFYYNVVINWNPASLWQEAWFYTMLNW